MGFNQRALVILTGLVLLGFVFLLAPQLFTFFHPSIPEEFVKKENIQGMAVVHNETIYTLNFKQQNRLVDWFNTSQRLSQKGHQKTKIDIEKIVIYLFKEQNIEIEPITYENDTLIFSAPAWYAEGYLKETSAGAMKTLLSQTYDPS